MLNWLRRWWSGEVEIDVEAIDRERALFAVIQQCRGYRCATCLQPLWCYSAENDFLCKKCGTVDAVRTDGTIVAGTGHIGQERVIGHLRDRAPISYAYHAWLLSSR